MENNTDMLQLGIVIVVMIISVIIFWKFGNAIGKQLGEAIYNLRH